MHGYLIVRLNVPSRKKREKEDKKPSALKAFWHAEFNSTPGNTHKNVYKHTHTHKYICIEIQTQTRARCNHAKPYTIFPWLELVVRCQCDLTVHNINALLNLT